MYNAVNNTTVLASITLDESINVSQVQNQLEQTEQEDFIPLIGTISAKSLKVDRDSQYIIGMAITAARKDLPSDKEYGAFLRDLREAELNAGRQPLSADTYKRWAEASKLYTPEQFGAWGPSKLALGALEGFCPVRCLEMVEAGASWKAIQTEATKWKNFTRTDDGKFTGEPTQYRIETLSLVQNDEGKWLTPTEVKDAADSITAALREQTENPSSTPAALRDQNGEIPIPVDGEAEAEAKAKAERVAAKRKQADQEREEQEIRTRENNTNNTKPTPEPVDDIPAVLDKLAGKVEQIITVEIMDVLVEEATADKNEEIAELHAAYETETEKRQVAEDNATDLARRLADLEERTGIEAQAAQTVDKPLSELKSRPRIQTMGEMNPDLYSNL